MDSVIARVTIRDMEFMDVLPLAMLEEQAHEEIPTSDVWTYDDLRRVFQKCQPPFRLVAQMGRSIVGYALCEVLPAHQALVLRRVFVESHHRRCHIGSELVGHCIGELGAEYCCIVHGARESNLVGQIFLRDRCEFRAVHPYVSKRFFRDTGEDAYILAQPDDEAFLRDVPERIRRRFHTLFPIL